MTVIGAECLSPPIIEMQNRAVFIRLYSAAQLSRRIAVQNFAGQISCKVCKNVNLNNLNYLHTEEQKKIKTYLAINLVLAT